MNPLYIVAPLVGAAALLGMSEAGANSPVINYGSSMSSNIEAFKAVIREGESSNNYRAMYGGGQVSDFSHHPGWTDSNMNVKSSWVGADNSHAAGAYQFQPQTFKEASDACGLGGDFSPSSQDIAAEWLIIRRGAYSDIVNGFISSAVDKLRNEWAFLDAWGVDRVISTFESNGGYVA